MKKSTLLSSKLIFSQFAQTHWFDGEQQLHLINVTSPEITVIINSAFVFRQIFHLPIGLLYWRTYDKFPTSFIHW